MVNYEKLLDKPFFLALNNKRLLVEPMRYGGASLRGVKLNQGVRAILHGGEYIVPAKLVHLIPKSIKDGVKKKMKKILLEKSISKRGFPVKGADGVSPYYFEPSLNFLPPFEAIISLNIFILTFVL